MAEKFGIGLPEDYRQAQWLSIVLEGKWRYDHAAEAWHHWDGVRWAIDDTDKIRLAVARAAADAIVRRDLGDGTEFTEVAHKSITKLLSIGPQTNALAALATFEDYGTNGEDWDADPWLLGCKNGIVDLRVNALVKARADMKVTKSTGVVFEPSDGTDWAERAPTFMRAMEEWMSGDPAMVSFLLLWFGSSLFGFTPEQRFLLMTGIGRNGKGALKHSILRAVGEYGAQFDANLYMRTRFGAARSDQARADLIALKGKRVTFFSEPEGNRFNEELLKAHTGGDRITARALHSNVVQNWDPTHAINFLVNNAPEVEDLGPSMAARVMVVDFLERFDGDKEDKQLYGVLEREAPGILAILCWAASAWHASWSAGKGGITLPPRVVEASKHFMERNDPIANAINEAFEVGADLTCQSKVAYDAYVQWHARSGREDEAVSMVRFAQVLEKKGFTKVKTRTANLWKGLRPLGAMRLADREGADDAE